MSKVKLDDKYTQTEGRVYLNGSQALVRLALMQRQRDLAAGHNVAGFISGYRGSPLGTFDLALWQADKHLREHHVHFQPGVNEDLAATSVWGSQQVNLIGGARYDGVFAMWYGKGPGVDRSGDALKHGNYAGSSPLGGVLVLCGDDHGARSSTVAHQSEHGLIHFGMPILHPATVQDYLDLGLYGYALSRYSGCWVGFKCVTDTVESSASVEVDANRVSIQLPTDFEAPTGGLNIRLGFYPLQAEKQLYEQRHRAVHAFARANQLDKQIYGRAAGNRLGIVTTGKAYLDVIEGLRRLGIDQARAAALGIAVYKVALVWPLEPTGAIAFAEACEELLVVEEKRPVLEEQLAHTLYNAPSESRPRLTGKADEAGAPLLSSIGELDPDRVLQVIAARYLRLNDDAELRQRWRDLSPVQQASAGFASGVGQLMRMPSFCAGCPHNTSTRVPEGSKALGGIGCHGMAVWMPERNTLTLYQMGGEGAPWIGQAPFVDMPHIFQNLGDGTYFHSGLLAIRACVAANVNITYKILLNGAIAMTGGQPIEGQSFDGGITGPRVARQVYAEGVRRIAVVTEVEGKHNPSEFPAGATFHHRDDLDAVQRELREWPGVSALIYDQACATERRRMRKRGKLPDPAERLFIHREVCEGCGDCGVQSNCVALEPEETSLGRKRRINQSVCNKDYSCVKGLCPSFVTVSGGKLKGRQSVADTGEADRVARLPEPVLPALTEPFSILVAGIGGNGVITVGALLGMAAHLEDRPCTVLDITGLAQRNGAVASHVRFAMRGDGGHAARIPQGAADLVVGCDAVVAAGPDCLAKMSSSRTAVVYNQFVAPTSGFAQNPDLDFASAPLVDAIRRVADVERMFGLNASAIAVKLLGDAIGANLLLIGYAWQRGLIPLSRHSIETAIELNGTGVALNLRAFGLGRLAAADPTVTEQWLAQTRAVANTTQSLAEIVAQRRELLRAYQDDAYAERYAALVGRVAAAEQKLPQSDGSLARVVARVYAKLLAYKDEYEVARLFTSDDFMAQLRETFEGDFRLSFNLAPPLWARRDATTGRPRKTRYGSWMMTGFRALSRLRRLRGTAFDVFGYSAHRRLERQLIVDYRTLVERLLQELTADNYAVAVKLAGLYDRVRGYDVVKEQSLVKVRAQQTELLSDFSQPLAVQHVAAAVE